jgi:probable phosphoglycerate mutase
VAAARSTGGAAEPSVTELVLVRHGQGECNAAGVIGGAVGCSGLSELGRWQSERLAQRLAGMHASRRFDVLLSSPRPRVAECAQIIAARLVVAVTVAEVVRGQEFGVADGQRWDDVVRAFGGPPVSDPDRPVSDGAEAWNAYAGRVLAGLARLLHAHAGRRLLLVGHGKTTGLAGAMLSGAADPRGAAGAFVLEHGALSHWCEGPSGWQLLVHDDTSHLGRGSPRDRELGSLPAASSTPR